MIATGFANLDKLIGGFFPGEFIVIGSRPSVGKTQLLINLSLNIARTYPTLFFSFDLSEYLLACRYLSTLSGFPVNKILQQTFTPEERIRFDKYSTRLSQINLLMNCNSDTSINTFKSISLRQIKDNGIKVIFVDILQMITTDRNRANREQEVSFISAQLKKFAKKYEVCIIATSQLSRSVETRKESKVPILSDLRDSGSIEQDADKVIFIYRPEYHGVMNDEMGNNIAGETHLYIAKNKNGATGMAKLIRDPEFTTFSDFIDYYSDFNFSSGRLNEI